MITIGQAAKRSGISAKMIRHYESRGLLPPCERSPTGYRLYNKEDLHSLRFIKQARSLGFSLDQIDQLLSLWRDRQRASADVKSLALTHIDELDKKIQDLQAMRNLLMQLAASCHGDQRPDCPILAGLALGQTDRP